MTAIIPEVTVAPALEQNELAEGDLRTNQATAKEILERHVAGLDARKQHDLLCEKLLLHIDGGGDLQYAEIYNNDRIVIPEMVSAYKKPDNLLRLVVDNAVSHHTATPFKFFADSLPDREAREKALMDSLWMNHVSWRQDLNGLVADALYMAMPAGFCFDSDTEVLTEDGFKLFKDVDVEVDRIASLDPHSGKLTYAKAIAKQELKYDGLMLHWSTRYLDLMVTPEHRMLVYQRQREVSKIGASVGEWIPPYHNGDPEKRSGELRFVSAFDVAQQGEVWVRKDAVWEGEEPEIFTLPKPTSSKYGRASDKAELTVGIEDYLRFMGWYLSEGSCYYSPPRAYEVHLTQKDDATRAELSELLARVTGCVPCEKRIQAVVHSKRLCEYVKQFGHSWEKFVPPEIKAMSPRLIRIFLDALFRGDGSFLDGRWTAYYTSSPRLRDDVQELLLKVGLSSSVRTRQGSSDPGEVNGVRIKVRRDCYDISVNHDNLRPQVRGEPGVVAYKGTVWDLTVPPNGTLFVRRSGKVVWSGNCPLHAYWSENAVDQHEPISHAAVEGPEAQLKKLFDPQPGRLDLWLGNPFDTVFDNAARRGSIHWCSYGRVLPADLVRRPFSHMPGVDGLQGTTNIPSASQWQRIASKWNLDGIGRHGNPILTDPKNKAEELMTVICREVQPGYEAAWPRGRLQIIAVPEFADRERSSRTSHAVLLYDGELPGGDFSFTNFYSHHRGDDVHGKPWVEDIDVNQVDLNIALSEYWEYLQKMKNTPLMTPGGAIADDMANLNGYDILEVETTIGGWQPRVPKWPIEVLTGLEKVIADKRSAIWRGGGYQAASRGESAGTRQAAKAITALQVADNSIHTPVNMRLRRSLTDFAQNQCWKQMKTYGDVGWLIDIVGDEYEHMVEPYIDRTKLSDRPPSYKLVNAFGPSPELRMQEVLELGQMRTGDGLPVLTNEEVRYALPDQTIFNKRSNPKVVAVRRAKTVAAQFHFLATQVRQQTGFEEWDMQHPWVLQLAQTVWQQIGQQFPVMRSDDLQAHIDSLVETIQDETADPIARNAAMRRLDEYYAWQAEMAAQMMPAPGALPGGTTPQPQTGTAGGMAQSGGGAVLG